jgi:hypothetical protein
MYITHRPVKGLGYNIDGRTDRHADIRKGRDKDRHADIRKGRDKEAIFFLFSRRLGYVLKENFSVSLYC